MEPSPEDHQPSRTVTPLPSEQPQENGNDDNHKTIGIDEEDNKFQQAIAAWRNVDLTSLVPKLDQTATDIVEHQKEALEQRKDLAQKTRDFRKLDDAGKLSEYKALLKGTEPVCGCHRGNQLLTLTQHTNPSLMLLPISPKPYKPPFFRFILRFPKHQTRTHSSKLPSKASSPQMRLSQSCRAKMSTCRNRSHHSRHS